MDYIGEKCPVCNKEFTGDDDIVVCPECGAPHHRECYKLENKCAYADRHENGFKWKRTPAEGENGASDEQVIICPVCHSRNSASVNFCGKCGSRLHPAERGDGQAQAGYGNFQGQGSYQGQQGAYRSGDGRADMETVFSYLGFDPNEDMGEGSTLKDVSSFVGSNTLYYIPIFKRMKDFGTKISFNLSCLIFPHLYFANRRMWFWAILATVVSIICSLPNMIVTVADMINSGIIEMAGTDAVVSFVNNYKNDLVYFGNILGTASWVVNFACCIFGNWLYYRHSLRSLKRLKERGIDGTSNPAVVMSAGGAKPVNMIIVMIIMGVIGSAAMAGFISYSQLLNVFIL